MIQKIVDKLYGLIYAVCSVLMILEVLVVSYIVFGRYVLKSTPPWGEELGLMCLVWIAMLSSIIALRDNTHMKMTLIDYIMPKKVVRVTDTIVNYVILAFLLFMLAGGIQFTILTAGNVMPGLDIPVSWTSISLPIMCVCGLAVLGEKLFLWVRRKKNVS